MSKPAKQLKGRAGRLARLMPSGPSNAARAPFVLLVVLLLGGGLIGLLLLNSSLNEGSFRLSELKKQTTELTDEQQALQRDVDARSAPDALERRARQLGMVPGGSPVFLEPDGTVRGEPSRAAAPSPDPGPMEASSAPRTPEPGTPPPSPKASPSPGASPKASPGADPAAGPRSAPRPRSGQTAPPPRTAQQGPARQTPSHSTPGR
ncbi:septum formation initiator [Streptomyces sp. NPDC050504]|uniref:septum formation initiator n=1 Tax=Streptomyces sp. NPDC050504 TaxID=3365618 RepID=UPI0037964ADE